MQNILPFIHPALMWGAVGLYLYTAYLGWQSRRVRFVKGETRKELIQNHVGAKHAKVALLLLGLLLVGGGLGAYVSYQFTKVFLGGLHGQIGALMMLLIIGAASLAPVMRTGVAWARTVHAGIGMLLLLLYLFEIPSGMQIVQGILKAN
jgi:hypothetical protein